MTKKKTKTAAEVARIKRNIQRRVKTWGKYGFNFPEAENLKGIDSSRSGLSQVKKIQDQINRRINVMKVNIAQERRSLKKVGKVLSDDIIKRKVAGRGVIVSWGETMRQNLYSQIEEFANPHAREIAKRFFEQAEMALTEEEFNAIIKEFMEEERETVEYLTYNSDDNGVDGYLTPALGRLSSRIASAAGMRSEEVENIIDQLYDEEYHPAYGKHFYY